MGNDPQRGIVIRATPRAARVDVVGIAETATLGVHRDIEQPVVCSPFDNIGLRAEVRTH